MADDLASAVSDVLNATSMDATLGEPSVSESIVAHTRELVPDAEHVSITIRQRKHSFKTLAASSDLAVDLDAAQYALRQGPCVDMVTQGDWVRSGEIARDARWPAWGPFANSHGMNSLLSVRLEAAGRVVGALNMYTSVAGRFSDRATVDTGLLWSVHAAASLSAAQKITGLESALASRHVIGMAQGIIMKSFGVDAATAFHVLSRLSSTRNVKVRDLAEEICRTLSVPAGVES